MLTENDILRDHLQVRGLKKTQQRFDILDAFLGHDGHITAYVVHSILKKKHKGIGFSTVYRALRLFSECGLAHEVNFGDGQARYEKAFRKESHGHLICTNCRRTEEFDMPGIEKARDQIAGKYGYKLSGFKFEIYGLCRKCRQ